MDLFTSEAIKSQKAETMSKAKEPKGTTCPCCGQFVKVYRRSITSTMAAQLIRVWKKFGESQWFHITDEAIGYGHGDFAKLRYWGLLEGMDHEKGDEGKRTSGYWRVTEKGGHYAARRIRLPEYCIVYNGEKMGFDGKQIDIAESLGKKFNYRELMNAGALQ
jgi:hypothetical protein